MAIENSKLTSVKVLRDLYNKFRVEPINSDMNLQRLTNRCIHLYLNNDDFRETINELEDLTISGSGL